MFLLFSEFVLCVQKCRIVYDLRAILDIRNRVTNNIDLTGLPVDIIRKASNGLGDRGLRDTCMQSLCMSMFFVLF